VGMCGCIVHHLLAHQQSGQVHAGDELMSAVVVKECSASGEDCSKSICCKTKGFQCFKKNERWAGCRPWCTVGPDPTLKMNYAATIAVFAAAASATSLTPDNWDASVGGKTVFIKFQAPW